MEALQNSLALHEIRCILNLEYDRSELLLLNHRSIGHSLFVNFVLTRQVLNKASIFERMGEE